MGDASMAANADRSRHHNQLRIYNRLYCEFVAGMGDMGLQQDTGKYPGADMSEIHRFMDMGGSGRDCAG